MTQVKIDKERFDLLRNEAKISKSVNEEALEPILIEAIERYTGRFYPRFGQNWDILLNEIYPIIQSELPSIFFRNPRAFLKPRNKTYISKKRNPVTGKMEDVVVDSGKSAKTQEAILNYKVSQIGYKKECRKVLLDALLFTHGVMWHGYKGDFGMTEEQSINIYNDDVFVRRINPLRFIFDPSVTLSTLDEAKWVGRIIDIPLIDLIEDDKFDVDKKLVRGFVGYGNNVDTKKSAQLSKNGKDMLSINASRRPMLSFAEDGFSRKDTSKFVRLYETYMRPTKKELRNGERGKIIVFTDEQEKPLRVNNWVIKAEGFPAKILQFNELNDNQFGLSDMEVWRSISDQKNILTNILIRNSTETAKTWVGLAKQTANEEDVTAVKQGTNSIVVFDSESVKDRMFVASPGSGNADLNNALSLVQKNLEDKSGVTDLKRGFLQSGEESATSVKIRSAGGGARPAYRQDIMSDFHKESYLYLNQLIKQFVDVPEAVRIVGSLDIEWSDNPSKEELQADVDVEIDAISMLPENPERELQEFNQVLQMMIVAVQDPAVRQKIQQEGKTINLAPIIEQILLRLRVRDPDVFRNIEAQESEGFVSAQQLREAQQNIQAILTGQEIPFLPKVEDDHRVKLEVYGGVNQVVQSMGQRLDVLEQLIQVQSSLLAQLQEKESKPGTTVTKPSIARV